MQHVHDDDNGSDDEHAIASVGKHQHNRYSAMKISKPEKRQRRQWLYGISSKELLHHNILKSIETPTNAFEEQFIIIIIVFHLLPIVEMSPKPGR